MKMFFIATALLMLIAISGCTAPTDKTLAVIGEVYTSPQTTSEVTTTESAAAPTPALAPAFEVELVAKVLRGECYDDQPDDKREVVKVICNRVAAGNFGGSVEAVITAPHQFAGYRPTNEPTENDYAIAREVLTVWYENGCEPMGEYLYFSAGKDHRNIFRREWREAGS
jgi:hypothetical protein